MLKGRLGLESARIPHADRHGLLWLGRGQLYVAAGTLRFRTAGDGDFERGDYALPFQMVSCMLLQPGTSVSHDALRLLARHGTCLVCTGEDGVRFYASLPAGPDSSARARRQAQIWSAPDRRIQAVLQLYAWRLDEVLPATDLDALRGIEGARMKETYRRVASQFGIEWHGRRYDRAAPSDADIANQAINHAASAVEGAALTAVAATGTLPQLGFIHEDSGNAFALDVADLFRDEILLPIAFGAARKVFRDKQGPVERVVRQLAGETFRRERVVSRMIDRIKELLDADDDRGDP
jgi:CRISP-associated protein Cas1